jgi:MFS family permease
MAHLASAETPTPQLAADRWTAYSVTVWAICMLGFAFDIYEATIMQLVTPLLIKEWGIAPATIGNITTVSRWVGLIGIFVFPTLADLYGRRPVLVLTILGYSLFTGLTGFAQGPLQLLIFTSITRITLQGETPVGMIMVSETAPTKWRATALGGLVGGYPFGYMLCSLTALVVVPLWGWRSLYWLGILPALLVLWVRLGVKESPRFERVTSAMLTEGLRKRLDIWSPIREYPREMLTATLLYFFYLFTWIGWSAWIGRPLSAHVKKEATPAFFQGSRFPALTTMAGLQANWDFLSDFQQRGTLALDELRAQAAQSPWGVASNGRILDEPRLRSMEEMYPSD